MSEILKKLPEQSKGAVERTMQMLGGCEQTDELLLWRLFGMADILFVEGYINADEYCEMLNFCKTYREVA